MTKSEEELKRLLMKVKSEPTLPDPMDCSPPQSSIHGISQARVLEWGAIAFSRKTSTYALLTMPKPLTVWITTNCGKFLKRWEYQITLPASWEICMQVKKQQLKPDMGQGTGSKLGKEYNKAMHCHPAYLTSMQSTSWETLGWKNHKLASRLPGEISITSDMQMTPPLWQKVKRN